MLAPAHLSCRSPYRRGFTIVELLIVIVVISVLASITIVAYNGIQQRANNAAIIGAANQSLRMVQSYIAANGTYPATVNSCITTTTGCIWGGNVIATNASFDTNIATSGTVPRSVPVTLATDKGVFFGYSATRTMNGAAQPAVIIYYLSGVSQQCGLSGVTSSGGDVMTSSSSGYTANIATTTACVVTIPGP